MKRLTFTRPLAPSRNSSFRGLRCEPLEDRRMLSVLFVDDNAAAGGNGSGWESAFDDLQDALSHAVTVNADGDTGNDVDQIWIAEGVYKPSAELEPGDPRSASFKLVDGVTLYGGFAGTEAALGERDSSANVTTLSGDLGVADDPADNAYTVVYCGNDVEAGLDGVTVSGGNADGAFRAFHYERTRGGGIYNRGSLTVTNSILRGNAADADSGEGGGVYNAGTLTITNSTLSENSANGEYGQGGAVYNDDTLVLTNATILGNSVNGQHGHGGGIYNLGTLTMTNSIVSGNAAHYSGGGIHNYRGTATVTNSTVTHNSSGSSGGGIYNDGELTLRNSIFWENADEDLYNHQSTSASQNLIGIDPGFVRNPSDGGDGWGDDPTTSHIDESANDDFGDLRLTSQSPAIDYGDDELAVDADGNPLAIDLDGNPRKHNGSPVDVGAYEFQSDIAAGRENASVTVDTAEDVFDVFDGQISLREAMYYAGPGVLGTTVTFDPTLDGATLLLGGTSLWIDKGLVIDASALTSLTIDADQANSVFSVIASKEDAVELNHLIVTGGEAWNGGGVTNTGALTITDSEFVGNFAKGGGGGIHNTGLLTVTNSTLSGNSARGSGGGIQSSGTLTVANSTFSGNSADVNGDGIRNLGTLAIYNSIFWHNGDEDLFNDTTLSASRNLVGIDPKFVRNPSDGGDGWGDDPATPGVDEGANDDYGDLRLTAYSPAIDYGDDELAVDAGGNPLSTDVDGNPRKYADSPVDAGAFEFQGDTAAGRELPSLTVNVSDDVFDLCDGLISLREAIYYAGSASPDTTVLFAPALDGSRITLDGHALWIDKSLTVDASTRTSLTIDAENGSGVFTVTAREEDVVELNHLTLSGGSSYDGGAVYSTGTLTVTDCVLAGNSADGGFGDGGAIYNAGTLTVSSSTIVDNSARGDGGGICNHYLGTLTFTDGALRGNMASGSGGGVFNQGTLTIANSSLDGNYVHRIYNHGGGVYNRGSLTIVNSTLTGNSAANGDGGGIYNYFFGDLTITNSTLVSNLSEGKGGGIYNHHGTLTFNNSILTTNAASSGPDLYQEGGTVKGSHNLICNGSDQTAFVEGIDGNLVGTLENPIDPLFIEDPSDGGDGWMDDPDTPDIDEAANNDYGDLRLRLVSPAVDAGEDELLPTDDLDLDSDGDTTERLPVDIRGRVRISDGNDDNLVAVDMGAYETSDTSILYVRADAVPGGDGTSWSDAVNNLQDALSQAVIRNASGFYDDKVSQIWIAQGVYTPNAGTSDPRGGRFSLVDGVTLYGGFAGTETKLRERDFAAHVTTLSGDMGVVGDPSDNAYTVVYCNKGVDAALDGVTVTGGNANGSVATRGGGIFSSGDLTVANCNIVGNTATGDGGGIYSFYTLTVVNSAFSGNAAGGSGGGIYGNGTLTVTNGTFSGNAAGSGGGIRSTGSLTLHNSVLWRNDGGDLKGSDAMASARNLIGVDPKFVRDPSDGGDGWGDDPGTVDVDESANDDFGDLRLTAYSPAIDYGDDALAVDPSGNPLAIDLDGNPRMYDGSPVDAGAYELQGGPAGGREDVSLTVNTAENVFDLYDGRISLREAIYYAGTATPDATITFDGALDGATIALGGAVLRIDKPLTVDASMLTSLTIDAGGASRVFVVTAPEGDVVLNHLTITGGSAADGGGIYNSATLTVLNSEILENSADRGGGIYSIGELALTGVTLAGNASDDDGGGICQRLGTLTVTNSVLAGNSAGAEGGGIWSNQGALFLTNSTVAGNTAGEEGDGIYRYDSAALNNCIFWRNGEQDLFREENKSTARSLIGIDPKFVREPADGGDGWGDDPGTPDIDESENDDYGDLRLTSQSPAIDYGDDDLAVDADGNALTADLDGNPRKYASSAVDGGAYEYQGQSAPGRESASLTVDTAEDVFDLYDGRVSLREAIYYAGTGSLGRTITFDSAMDDTTITLDGASLRVDRSLTVDASMLTSLTVDAAPKSRVFLVIPGGEDAVELKHLTITGGSAIDGGGIYSCGTLAVTDCTLLENVAGNNGGGIYNDSDSTLTVTNGTLSRNVAGNNGGGIHNLDGTLTMTSSLLLGNVAKHGGGVRNYGGTLSVANSVFSGNSAENRGGAIDSYGGTLTFTNSTFAGNVAGEGGAVRSYYSTLTLHNAIVAENAAQYAPDVCCYPRYSAVLTGSHNLIGVNTGQSAIRDGIDGNIVGTSTSPVNPLFVRNPSDGGDGWGDDPDTPDIDESANDDYGNLHLRANSPALNAGDDTLLPADRFDLDADGDTVEPIPFDLGGNARVSGSAMEIGAYEFVLSGIPGDLDNDYTVGSGDLDIIRVNWLATVTPGSLLDGDPSGDGTVNSADLDNIRVNWGSIAPAAAGVLEATKSDLGTTTPAAVYGPREATDAALRDWGQARATWAEAVEGLLRKQRDDVKTAERVEPAAAVDLAMTEWGGGKAEG